MSVIFERAKTHGDYSIQSALSQDLKRRIRQEGAKLTPQQTEAIEMICVKLARIVCGNPNEPDHYRDISGYAELILKSLEGQKPGDETQGTSDEVFTTVRFNDSYDPRGFRIVSVTKPSP